MEVKLEYRREFGNARFYPANELASALLVLIRRKSFTEVQLKLMRDAGFVVEISSEIPKF